MSYDTDDYGTVDEQSGRGDSMDEFIERAAKDLDTAEEWFGDRVSRHGKDAVSEQELFDLTPKKRTSIKGMFVPSWVNADSISTTSGNCSRYSMPKRIPMTKHERDYFTKAHEDWYQRWQNRNIKDDDEE